MDELTLTMTALGISEIRRELYVRQALELEDLRRFRNRLRRLVDRAAPAEGNA